MPLFKLNEHRYINTEYVADLLYRPAGDFHVHISFIGAAAEETSSKDIRSPHGSSLDIQLLNKDLLPLHLEGEEADAVWAAFQEARQQEKSDTSAACEARAGK